MKENKSNTRNVDGEMEAKNVLPILEPPRSYKEWVLQQKQKNELSIGNERKGDDASDKHTHNSRAFLPSTSQNGTSTSSSTSTSNSVCSDSNPLMCVSKHWAAASRLALHYEWRRGACCEWRVLGEVMGNERVTKASDSSS